MHGLLARQAESGTLKFGQPLLPARANFKKRSGATGSTGFTLHSIHILQASEMPTVEAGGGLGMHGDHAEQYSAGVRTAQALPCLSQANPGLH